MANYPEVRRRRSLVRTLRVLIGPESSNSALFLLSLGKSGIGHRSTRGPAARRRCRYPGQRMGGRELHDRNALPNVTGTSLRWDRVIDLRLFINALIPASSCTVCLYFCINIHLQSLDFPQLRLLCQQKRPLPQQLTQGSAPTNTLCYVPPLA